LNKGTNKKKKKKKIVHAEPTNHRDEELKEPEVDHSQKPSANLRNPAALVFIGDDKVGKSTLYGELKYGCRGIEKDTIEAYKLEVRKNNRA